MSRIEKGLHEHHARLQEQAQSNAAATASAHTTGSTHTAPGALEAPFAKVNSVVASSPAEMAGLQVGDSITKFGWVDWTNHDKLARLTQVVSQNEGVSNSLKLGYTWPWEGCTSQRDEDRANEMQLPIIVKVLRPNSAGPAQSMEMQLTPRRNWGGRGMLGCNLLPL